MNKSNEPQSIYTLPELSPNVRISAPHDIGRYVILGEPPRGAAAGELQLTLGAHAVIRSHAILYAGSSIGARFHAGHHALIREHCVIGDEVSVGSGTTIEHHVTLGNKVRIHSMAFICELSILEEGVWVGPCAVLTNARYPNTPTTKSELVGPRLKRGSIVGANVTILPGVEIGEDALIGAGSVVTANVPAGMVYVGNPARLVRPVASLGAFAFKELTGFSKESGV